MPSGLEFQCWHALFITTHVFIPIKFSNKHVQNNEGWNGQNSQTGSTAAVLNCSSLYYKMERAGVSIFKLHRKNSPLIRIDGDAVQLQRTEYGRCQTDVELHGVRLAVR